MITAQKIMEYYPRLYDRGVRCGFSCPEGWLPLVKELSTSIDHLLENWLPEGKPLIVTVEQIKEKFGGLCFYYDIDFDNEDEELNNVAERIRGMVYFAESMSFRICEVCGAPGERRSGGWIRTLCEKHSGLSIPQDRKRKGSVALDFDGVINSYTSGFVGIDKLPDPPVPGAIDYLQELVDFGFTVYVYSTRNEQERGRQGISKYLLDHGLPEKYHKKIKIVSGKPKAKIYLDDRAWEFTGKFPSPMEIDKFLPWTKRVSSTQKD
jgi:hypothetical protein